MKFLRNYKLSFELFTKKTVTVVPPLEIEFNVQRNMNNATNTADIVVYNLPENIRHQLHQDWYEVRADKRFCKLEAGYGDTLHTIYVGEIKKANSVKNRLDWESHIFSWSGIGMYDNQISLSIGKGNSIQTVLNKAMDKVKLNYNQDRSAIIHHFGRGVVINDNAVNMLKKYAHDKFFIDNNTVYTIDDSKYIDAPPLYLGKFEGTNLRETPLLGSPTRTNSFLKVKCFFAPEASLGQKVILNPEESIYKGEYKVVRIAHTAVISQTEAGEAGTELQLYIIKKYQN